MLCNVCNDDIFDGDNLNCTKCNAIQHFGCAALRESAFRKMSKVAKLNWCCSKCKLNEPGPKTQAPKSNAIIDHIDTQNVHNETINNLVESINFMSEKFDIKEENSILKEENCKLKNELTSLEKRMNVIEQKSIETFVEIVGVPEVNNEDCVKTVESIAASVGVKLIVSKAFRVHCSFKHLKQIQKNNYVNILCCNIRSVNSNFDELTLFLANNPNNDKIDVIILTETWHNPLNQSTYIIKGYKLYFSTIV